MSGKLAFSIAAVALFLLSGTPALAGPMRCGDEHAACLSFCHKLTNPAYIPTCVTNCHTAQSSCLRTGCWNNGVNNRCGYLRK